MESNDVVAAEASAAESDQLLNQHTRQWKKVVNDNNKVATNMSVKNSNYNYEGNVPEHIDQHDDPLLEKIAQAMNDDENTAPKISELANIINSRRLTKLREVFARKFILTYVQLTATDLSPQKSTQKSGGISIEKHVTNT